MSNACTRPEQAGWFPAAITLNRTQNEKPMNKNQTTQIVETARDLSEVLGIPIEEAMKLVLMMQQNRIIKEGYDKLVETHRLALNN